MTDIEYARGRARAGLWIGPGFFLVATFVVVGVARVVAPESANLGRALMLCVTVVSGLLHIGCFFEFVITAKYLGHRPLPIAIALLAAYWTLLAVAVIVAAAAS